MIENLCVAALIAVALALWVRRQLRCPCPSCGRRRGRVVDDLWDRHWGLWCAHCGQAWEERC